MTPWGVPAQVSVGRLGIITKLKFPIQPQMAVQRTVTISSMGEFVLDIMAAQERYKAALATGSQSAMRDALQPLDNVQVMCVRGVQGAMQQGHGQACL